MTLTVIAAYLALVLMVGVLSHRFFRGTGEDYFLATRSIGPFVLLMSLFGTQMTAFALLGASGQSYRTGIGVFGLMASSSAIVVPTVFFFVGTRAWAIGKRYGYTTQVEYIRDRWESDFLGLLLFISLVALLIPYLLIGVMGAGITLSDISGGQVPTWVGGLVVSAVVMTYVTYGGLRGTAWANTFQTLVFMTLGTVTFVYVTNAMGGLGPAFERIARVRPDLLVREGNYSPVTYLTFLFIPLSAGMFPHLFMHWLTASKLRHFRTSVVAYPLCIAVVWIPSVLLGVFGNINFPELTVPESNAIMVRLIEAHAPEFLAGLLGAGIFAAVMSSLDSQALSLGTMFTKDIVLHYGYDQKMTDQQQVLVGRIFVASILVVTYLLSLITRTSIFAMGTWSFTGFAGLFPIIVAALFWRRSTKLGAFASLLTVAALWTYYFIQGWGQPDYSVGGTGIMPVAVIVTASVLAMLVGSLLSSPPCDATVRKFFPA
ncbi:MAG: sodium:solute symporter family protein [Acidobacteriota bacterium]|nr:sodium:solute symporter family protein [Acidobacteriota bacterium]